MPEDTFEVRKAIPSPLTQFLNVSPPGTLSINMVTDYLTGHYGDNVTKKQLVQASKKVAKTIEELEGSPDTIPAVLELMKRVASLYEAILESFKKVQSDDILENLPTDERK